MGDDPDGFVVYTPDGTMLTTIGRRDRQPVGGGDPLGGPPEARLAALDTFLAYAARWETDGDDVLHRVTMSLFPDWVGTTQRRHVALRPRAFHRLVQRHDARGIGQHLVPLLAQAHRLARPVEQRAAEVFFQPADLRADRRLRQAKAGAGGGKGAGFCGDEEGLEIAEHGAVGQDCGRAERYRDRIGTSREARREQLEHRNFRCLVKK